MSGHTAWEYKEVYLNWGARGFDVDDNVLFAEPLEDQLNKLGEDGWELVQLETIRGGECGNALLKRIRRC